MPGEIPRSDDFETLASIGIFAPTSPQRLSDALAMSESDTTAAISRLRAAGLIRDLEGSIVLSFAGHETLSRKKFRRVRDVGRMLYLWRGSRGKS